ncbi:MAG: phage holin family protein [Burkholderiaceae bacterium]
MGLEQSLKGLASRLVAIAGTRLELAAVDLEDGLLRMAILLLAGIAGVLLLVAGSMFGAVALLIWQWDAARLLTASLIGIGYVVAAGVIAGVAWRSYRDRPPLLHATLAELQADRRSLGEHP